MHIGQYLDVGQASAVVCADVDELPAGPAGAGRAIGVDSVAGPLDAPKLLTSMWISSPGTGRW